MRNSIASNMLGLAGATVGGVLGYSIYAWIVGQGFYGLMIPGAMLGLGCSLLAQQRSLARGIVCGVAAVALGLYSEWRIFPFVADPSFTYLVTHIHLLKPLTLLMIGLGGAFGFWMGRDANPLFGEPDRPGPRTPPSNAKSE
jgi:hypothetical protein